MSPRPGPVGVDIIGAGAISEQYLSTLERFSDADVRIVGDVALDRAEDRTRRHGVGAWGSAKDVLAHDGVETVVNLTNPAAAHPDVSTAAVAAGRHVWSEKSLAVEPLEARTLLDPGGGRTAGGSRPPAPSSVRVCIRHAGPSPAGTSAPCCRCRPSYRPPAPTPGTPTRNSTSPWKPARCSTWAPAT
ncbi:Gfo/Idh/MocA family protein [Streptomyces sp. NPDC087769]|uniref:Gfo/Idh/MocA family protein n=1 Tax=Streptomyces sp. NPDC087769 TaxID=3365802 RepID=UPI003802BE85